MNTVDPSQFFQQANEVAKKVDSGEITGITKWPELSGQCFLEKVTLKKAGINNIIQLFVSHDSFGKGNFGIFLPKVSNKDFANAKRMEQLYATVYAAGGTKASESVQTAYTRLAKKLSEGKIPCEYKLELKESESASTGKVYENQDLVMLKAAKKTEESAEESSGFSI